MRPQVGDYAYGRGWSSGIIRAGVVSSGNADEGWVLTGAYAVDPETLRYNRDEVPLSSYLTKEETTPVKDEITPRQEILDEASKLIHGDRNASYGSPTQNFENTAALLNVQLGHKLKEPLTATDVALVMIQLKMARIIASPKRDNWADIIGYAACGFETDEASRE